MSMAHLDYLVSVTLFRVQRSGYNICSVQSLSHSKFLVFSPACFDTCGSFIAALLGDSNWPFTFIWCPLVFKTTRLVTQTFAKTFIANVKTQVMDDGFISSFHVAE